MAWRMTVEGVGKSVDDAVADATIRALRFFGDVQVVAHENLGVDGQDWYIEDVTAILSAGGTTVGVSVDFVKCEAFIRV